MKEEPENIPHVPHVHRTQQITRFMTGDVLVNVWTNVHHIPNPPDWLKEVL